MNKLEKEIADLLRETAKAHHDYEVETGQPDEDWPAWYASHMLKKIAGLGMADLS